MLELAQQFSFVTYPTVIAIGVTQGLILGEAITDRFPKMQYRTRLALISLFLLFTTHAIVSVIKFAYPEKINISQIFTSPTLDQLLTMTLKVVGLNAGIGAVIAFSITLIILILMRLTGLKGYRSAFLITISIIMIIIVSTVRLSDYKPTGFEIFLYMLYQGAVTGGVIWGMRRRLYSSELRIRNFSEWWTGRLDL
jgi:hypothetical protein